MMKRDRIFYGACGLSVMGLALTIMRYDLGLLFFVAAFLLRPTLHEFGLAKRYADEREREIHSRSGNLAFITVMLAVGMALWRIADGKRPDEIYTLIGIGLAARALTGIVMGGEYRKAGVVIITAMGVLLAVFVVLMEGLSVGSAFGALLGLIIIGLGQAARKIPRVIAVVLLAIAAGVIMLFALYEFRRVNMGLWLFFVTPALVAAACLVLGAGDEDRVISPRVRSAVFGSLAMGAVVVFALLIAIGGRETQSTWRTERVPEGEVTEIQGVSCAGQIDYYKNGNLESCTLSRNDTLSGQPLPAGTVVVFTEDGVFDWCFLQHDTEIQGHLCRGQGHGFMTAFYPNGTLRQAWLAEDEVIQGIPCSKFRFFSAVFGGFHGKNGGTYFYPNGQLRSCELSRNATIEGREFRRGDLVKFRPDGHLMAEGETASASRQ